MQKESLPAISALSVLFGTTLVASRFAVGQFAPLTYVALRLALAGLGYLGVYAFARAAGSPKAGSAQGRRIPRDPLLWRHGAVLGLFGTAAPMSLIVMSLLYQSSGVTALLLTLGPAVMAIMAHFFLPEEKLTRRTAVGILIAMSGAAVLVVLGENGLPDVSEANPLGYVLVGLAHLSGGSAIIYTRLHLREADIIDTAAIRVWTALAIMLPLSVLVAGLDLSAVTASGYAALGYAALFGTFLAMLLEVAVIQRFGATATAMTANFIPIVALIAGALFLGEEITPGMIGAMVMILGGVTILTRNTAVVEAVPLGD